MMQLVEIMASLKLNQLQAFIRISKDSGWCYTHSKSDLLSIHRYCRDRFVDLVPAVDVDPATTSQDLTKIQPTILEILACFDNPR